MALDECSQVCDILSIEPALPDKGREGRTEGTITPRGHMEALVMRAAREGVRLEQQIW